MTNSMRWLQMFFLSLLFILYQIYMFLILRIQYILKYSHKIEFLCKSSWIVLYRQPHIKHLGGINSSGCRISVYFYPLHNMNRYMMNLLPLICYTPHIFACI